MIVFDLICGDGHRFEVWFKSGAAFDQQQRARAIACPLCGDRAIGKAPMAPHVARGASAGEAATATPERADDAVPAPILDALRKLRKHIEANCDYVGPTFPEQARRIHYGEAASRDIYGEASSEQAEELREEGIEIRSIPWLPRRDG